MTVAAEVRAVPVPSPDVDGPAILIEDLSVSYGETAAVRGLYLQVPHGSIYGLTGPAGAGKSTTLRVLATVQPPGAGTVLVEGIDLTSNPGAVRARIGYLPDFSGVYEGLTVSEYLNFYGSMYGVPARRRRQVIGELLELIGLADRLNHPVGSLSRGMRQQLGLARCLVHDPSILLLDEPAAGLDPAARLDLRDILQELARLGKTIVLSSHLLAELAAVCTHLGIMRGGELLGEGTVDEIIGAVVPDRRLRIQLLRPDDTEAARQLLAERAEDEVATAEARPACLTVAFHGDPADLAAILDHLTAGGIAVTEFALEHLTLEEVWLQALTTGGQEE